MLLINLHKHYRVAVSHVSIMQSVLNVVTISIQTFGFDKLLYKHHGFVRLLVVLVVLCKTHFIHIFSNLQ